jgi:amino acid transporter
MSVTATVGAGLYVLPGTIIALAGPAIIVVFILMAFFDTFNGLCYSELGAAFPKAGGSYTFVQKARAGFFSFMVGWMMWLGNSAAIAFYATGFARALKYFVPDLWIVGVSIAAVLSFAIINLRGVKEAGLTQNILTGVQMLFLLIFFIAMLPRVETDNYTPFTSEHGVFGIVQAMGLIVIMFVGNEFVASAGDEIKDPGKTIPKTILSALVISMVIYVTIFSVIVGVVGMDRINEIRETSGTGELAIVTAARFSVLGETGASIIALSAVAACLSSLIATFIISTRMFYALGRDAHFPRIFGTVDARRLVPRRSIIVCSILAMVLCLFGNTDMLAAISDYGYVFGIGIINYTVIMLRKKYPDIHRPFKVPFYPWSVYLAVIFNLMFIPVLITVEPMAVQIGVICTILGALFYVTIRRSITIDRRIRKLEKMIRRQKI